MWKPLPEESSRKVTISGIKNKINKTKLRVALMIGGAFLAEIIIREPRISNCFV